uniref:Uncharacterized protein n=1 Tax=Tanacetum cinerariifolium TaxID=118510 RepID=A0A699WLC4_TANCI|nr:hypothetical protein [Tanacetum cinerariifolium]
MAGAQRHHRPRPRRQRNSTPLLQRSAGKPAAKTLRATPVVLVDTGESGDCRRRPMACPRVESGGAGAGTTGGQSVVRSAGALRSRAHLTCQRRGVTFAR